MKDPDPSWTWFTIETCKCSGWQSNKGIANLLIDTLCARSDCNYLLIHNLHGLIIDSLSQSKQSNIKRDSVNYKMNNSISFNWLDFHNAHFKIPPVYNNEMNNFISSNSLDFYNAPFKTPPFYNNKVNNVINSRSIVSCDTSFRTPPFESPNIVEILSNFCLYKFGHNLHQLKIALKITTVILDQFNTWVWLSPNELTWYKPFQHSCSYEFYYERFLENCYFVLQSKSISSMIFGQDTLKYTFQEFRNFLDNQLINDSKVKEWTYSRRCFYMKLLPNYMNLLEKEIYASNSPIWSLNFNEMKIEVIEFVIKEMNKTNPQPPRKGRNRHSNQTASIKPIEQLNNLNIFKNLNKILSTLDDIKLDHITYLKGFLTGPQVLLEKECEKIQIVLYGNSNVNLTQASLWYNKLRDIYRNKVPRIPDRYIDRLDSDKNIQIIVMLEYNFAIGGIYFCHFKCSQSTEIIFSVFKTDSYKIEYETQLMDYLKQYHIEKKIFDLFVYADEDTFEFYANHNFNKRMDNPFRSMCNENEYKHHTGTQLMYCNLRKLVKE